MRAAGGMDPPPPPSNIPLAATTPDEQQTQQQRGGKKDKPEIYKIVGHPYVAKIGWSMLDTGASHHIRDGREDEDLSMHPMVTLTLAVGEVEAYQISEDALVFPYTTDETKRVGTIYSVD